MRIIESSRPLLLALPLVLWAVYISVPASRATFPLDFGGENDTILKTNGLATAGLLAGGVALFLLGTVLADWFRTLWDDRGPKRRPRYYYYRRPGPMLAPQKRSIDEEEAEEEVYMAEMLALAFKVADPPEGRGCFERLICDLAASGGATYRTGAILNVFAVEDSVVEKLPRKYRIPFTSLKLAGEMGALGDVEDCERWFPCDQSGEEMDGLIANVAGGNAVEEEQSPSNDNYNEDE